MRHEEADGSDGELAGVPRRRRRRARRSTSPAATARTATSNPRSSSRVEHRAGIKAIRARDSSIGVQGCDGDAAVARRLADRRRPREAARLGLEAEQSGVGKAAGDHSRTPATRTTAARRRAQGAARGYGGADLRESNRARGEKVRERREKNKWVRSVGFGSAGLIGSAWSGSAQFEPT